jgi:hypothetical protein
MAFAAPERCKEILDAGTRLEQAFERRKASAHERTKSAQQGRRASLDADDVEILEILLDLSAKEREKGGLGLPVRGAAGKIHDVLKQRRAAGLTRRRPWPVDTINDKLNRLKEEFSKTK